MTENTGFIFGFWRLIGAKARIALELWRKGEYFEIAIRLSDYYLPACLLMLAKSHIMAQNPEMNDFAGQHESATIKCAVRADIPKIAECSEVGWSENADTVFRQFLASGNNCYFVERAEQVIGYCWLFFGKYTITYDGYGNGSFDISLGRNSAFVGNVYVRSSVRRKGVYTDILRQVIPGASSSHGIRRFMTHVRSSNKPSLKAHARAGFVTISTLYYVSFLKVRLLLVVTDQSSRVYRVTRHLVLEV